MSPRSSSTVRLRAYSMPDHKFGHPLWHALAAARPSTMRAAWWAWRASRRLQQVLPVDGVRAEVTAPPHLPFSAGRGVVAGLRHVSPTCLERALVLQCWLAAHGDPRDVVIGVTGGSLDFGAHAWLDGYEPDSTAEFAELHRITPR